MDTKPALSVVIPAYNEEEFIRDCIESLLHQDFTHLYEIIVVDNGSIDATLQILHEYPDVIVIPQPIKGVAIARNTGFKAAKADIIVSTDADCRHPSDWLARIYAEMESDPALLAIGGYAILDDATIPRVTTQLGQKIGLLRFSKVLFGAQALSTQNLAVRKKAWEDVGGFDEGIVDPVHLDDADLTLRVGRLGKVRSSKDLFVYASSRRMTGSYKHFAYIRLRAYAHYSKNWVDVADRWYHEKIKLDNLYETIPVDKLYSKAKNKLSTVYKEFMDW